MARLGSKQIAGYYPTPLHLVTSLASIFEPFEGRHLTVLDPVAGDGEALEAFCSALSAPKVVPLACELERDRARALRLRGASWSPPPLEGDATLLDTSCSILYLNPPYDTDPTHRRLEHRFLRALTPSLEIGGALVFIVPVTALSACSAFLTEHYRDLFCVRFPPKDYRAFRQVVVFGHRRVAIEADDPSEILSWAEQPDRLPVLGDASLPRITVAPDLGYFVPAFSLRPFDCEGLLEELQIEPTKEELPAFDALIGGTFDTALPPKPAHIAIALAAGMLNGHEIRPDLPDRHPPLLAKGTLSRQFVDIDSKTNEGGEITSLVQVQRPSLEVHCLNLETFDYFQLAPGLFPNGGDDPSRWSLADLLEHYGASLTSLLRRQFPPLHDPSLPSHALPLPNLPRTPFRAQRTSIEAALKLLAKGLNPFLVAEVGTGKSTIALYLSAALHPDHRVVLRPALKAQGFGDRPPSVRRTLILCPPHLVASWQEQIAAVRPEASVVVLEKPSDVHRQGDIYILSRETAKLGHPRRGVGARCPRCGSSTPKDERARQASKRLRCRQTGLTPVNSFARLLLELIPHLVGIVPEHPTVSRLLPTHPALRHRDRPLSSKTGSLIPLIRRWIEHPVGGEDAWRQSAVVDKLLGIVASSSTAAPFVESLEVDACTRRRYVDILDARLRESPIALANTALARLWDLAEWAESDLCDEPLYQAEASPRRVPLSSYIAKRARFDLLIADEAHEYSNAATAQSFAFQRLAQQRGIPTVVLTGSLMNGYASSLFPLYHALSKEFRSELDRSDVKGFVERYGFIKQLAFQADGEPIEERGAVSDRLLHTRKLGEAPGILATFIVRHLLKTAVVLHKEDLDLDLPPMTEIRVPIVEGSGAIDSYLLTEYARLETALLDQLRKDRRDSQLAGRLIGQLVQLPSYLDRSAEELGPFEIRYPEHLGGALVEIGSSFPDDLLTPKERWLLDTLEQHRRRGEKAIVYLCHTGGGLPRRLARLVEERLEEPSIFLDASKVPTRKRQAWIDREVLVAEVPVLFVNPKAVCTGLNNLVSFSVAIWYEMDASTYVYRQANGRLHRIGQTRPVTIYAPSYAGTAQEILLDLVARKVSTSLQVDGVDVQAALEAAGVGPDDGLELALSIGDAVYKRLVPS